MKYLIRKIDHKNNLYGPCHISTDDQNTLCDLNLGPNTYILKTDPEPNEINCKFCLQKYAVSLEKEISLYKKRSSFLERENKDLSERQTLLHGDYFYIDSGKKVKYYKVSSLEDDTAKIYSKNIIDGQFRDYYNLDEVSRLIKKGYIKIIKDKEEIKRVKLLSIK
jgi:hypothetical protein